MTDRNRRKPASQRRLEDLLDDAQCVLCDGDADSLVEWKLTEAASREAWPGSGHFPLVVVYAVCLRCTRRPDFPACAERAIIAQSIEERHQLEEADPR